MKAKDIFEKIKGNEKLIGEVIGGFISSAVEVAELEFADNKYTVRLKFRNKDPVYPVTAERPGPVDDMGIYPKEMRDQQKKKSKKQYWTAERENLLRDNFFKKTIPELVQILPGFSEAEILAKAEYMGMKKARPVSRDFTGCKELSKQT